MTEFLTCNSCFRPKREGGRLVSILMVSGEFTRWSVIYTDMSYQSLLVACTRLNKSLCRSVGPSFRRSVRRSVCRPSHCWFFNVLLNFEHVFDILDLFRHVLRHFETFLASFASFLQVLQLFRVFESF